MLLLDIPRLAPREIRYVEIPFYHRPHLSLPQQARMSLCLLPNRSIRAISNKEPAVPELIAAPFEFDHWDRLWRFTATLSDREGLLRDLFDVVSSAGGDVLASESGTSQEEGVHIVESLLKLDSEATARRIEWMLGAQFCRDVVFSSDHRERLQVRRLETLYQAKRRFDKLAQSPLAIGGNDGAFRPQRAINVPVDLLPGKNGLIRSARLRLPDGIRSEVAKWVVGEGSGTKKQHFGYHYRMSDSKDRFLRVLFLRDTDTIVHSRLECRADPGALGHIVGSLAADGFNILSAFVTPVIGNRQRLELVVRLGGAPRSDTQYVKQAFRRSLVKVSEGLDIEYGYPENYHKDWKRISLRAAPSSMRAGVAGAGTLEQVTTRLEMTKGDLEKSVGEMHAEDDERKRLQFIRRLSTSRERLFTSRPDPLLFISCHYENPDEIRILQDAGRDAHFSVVTGQGLRGQRDLRGAIRGAMDACDVYLGVWSLSGALLAGATYWPSPWLLWEAGVAHALSLPTHLLVNAKLERDAWMRVYPDLPVSKFSEATFEREARALLLALRRRSVHEHRVPK